MKNKCLLILLLQLCYTIPAAAQSFAINTDGSTANASSILDVKSTVKGVLIPRLTTIQRTSIASPAKGLLVYDSTANSFWSYDGSAWQEMVAGNNTLWKKNGNDIYNTNTGRVGIGIINPDALLHVRGGAVLFDNVTGSTPVSGGGTRFMWIPEKRAIRAGTITGNGWDDANIGFNSVAFGSDSKAIGNSSTSIGSSTTASGTFTFATGLFSIASGNRSIAMGVSSTASGHSSTAIGYGNTASGDYATAIGVEIRSKSYCGFATGSYNDSSNASDPNGLSPLNRIFEIGNGTSYYRANAMTVLHNGNIGIGELNPAFPLNFASALGDKISLWGTGSNHYGFGIQGGLLQVYVDGSGSDIGFGYGNSSSFTERVRIKGNGNVGIGESFPNFPLNFAATLGDKISLWGNSSNHYGFGVQGGLLQVYADGSGSDIGFGYGNSASFTERVRFKGNGNVGIGLANPSRMLSVATDIAVDENDANNGTMANNCLHFGASWTGEAIGSKRTNGGNKWGLDFYTNYLNRMVITYFGNVGIGVYSPSRLLSVATDIGVDENNANSGTIGNSLHFGASTSGEAIGSNRVGGNLWGLDFYTNSANRLSISNTGNVGIGTTAPSQTLDVNGTTTTNGLQVDNGTVITKMQSGSVIVGSNGSGQMEYTLVFPVAFATSTPRVFATARNAPSTNFPDAFSVSVRFITSTFVVWNIQRTDINTNWTQQLRIDWFAVE